MATLTKSILTTLLFFFLISNAQSEVTFKYLNQCPYTVWLASRPANGEAQFELSPDVLEIFTMPDQWTGSIWLRTKCSLDPFDKFICETGDCGSGDITCQDPPPKFPVTLLNFQVTQSVVSYELSLVHGFNVPIRIEPSDGNLVDGTGPCPVVDCARDIRDVCPAELVAKNANGAYVGCNSACDALNNCQPNDYTKRFKELCPAAHMFPGDNNPPVYKCGGATSYNITFCPV